MNYITVDKYSLFPKLCIQLINTISTILSVCSWNIFLGYRNDLASECFNTKIKMIPYQEYILMILSVLSSVIFCDLLL